MASWEAFKEKITNPPPVRLASIEYKAQFMQIIAFLAAIIIFTIKGVWYVSTILFFAMIVTYTQAITAYRKWVMIASLETPEAVADYQHDTSPTRRRDKIIRHVLGGSSGFWAASAVAAIVPAFFLPFTNRIVYTISYIPSILLVFIFAYYFLMYWACLPVYNKEIRRLQNAKEKRNRSS